MDAVLAQLPNLSPVVIAVLVLAFMLIKSADQHERFLKELEERENSMRELEKEVRTSIMTQLNENTQAMRDTNVALQSLLGRINNRA